MRDPRDALYSEWRRQVRNGGAAAASTFRAFVHSPYYHHPFSFADYLVRFLGSWRDVLDTRPSLVVRYEDYRTAPLATLERAARFLGIGANATLLAAAVSRSDVSVLQRIERELAAKGQLDRQFNRRGMAFEHRQSYTREMHLTLRGKFEPLCQWLGYKVV